VYSFHEAQPRRESMRKLAFTLVELLVVIAIIGILSLVITFAIQQTSLNAKLARKDADLKSILTAIESKRAEKSTVLKNITKYNDPRIDKLLEDGRMTSDEERRKELYFDFQKSLTEDLPAIFLYHPYKYNVVYKNIEHLLEKLPDS